MIRRFWLQQGHATELAQRALQQHGWAHTEGSDWTLAWTLDLPAAATFAEAGTGRWVNHLRGIAALTVKSHLCHTLRDAEHAAAAAGGGALYKFAPQTFVLPAEWDEWTRARAWDPDAVWIQKPADSSRGRGVALVGQPDDVRAELRQGNGRLEGSLVVQRYVANPHLLDGYKYSLRFYVLITSIAPLIAYLFEDGFTKLASRPFSLAAADRTDRFRHLTNPDVLRDDPEAAGVSSRNTTHRQYRRRLRADGIDDAALFSRIRRVLAASLIAAQPRMLSVEQHAGGNGRGQFELLGVDIAIDNDLQPWLLECNLAPSLSVEASAETEASRDEAALKTQVVADTLRLIGADGGEAPPMPAASVNDARERLTWYDERRGGFDRLWPGPDALATLAGAELTGDMDRGLLADEAARGGWPPVRANGVDAIVAGDALLLFERPRDRITLLDQTERESWLALTRGTASAASAPLTWTHGIEWLRDGLLLPDSLPSSGPPRREDADEIRPRARHRWNHERVYAINGLRVAVQSSSARQALALDQALCWWDAGDLDEVDVTLFVPPRTSTSELLARLHRLTLRRLGGIVRRRLTFAIKGQDEVLIAGEHDHLRAEFGAGWTLISRTIVIGGSPFGAWIDDNGRLEPARVTAIAGATPAHGDLLLDLVSAGPGVVYAFDAEKLRALATWIESLPRKGGGDLFLHGVQELGDALL